MKKVISFSLWGNDLKYNIGAIRNAELAAEIYPDWECWFYITRHGGINGETFDILEQLPNVKIKVLHMNPAGGFALPDWTGMFWRFEAAYDPEVDIMISRDCDSRLSQYEKDAVDEWIASDKGFHIMRDHPWHGAQILGGMWGIKRNCLSSFQELMEGWKKEDRWQTDQDFLAAEIYPRVAGDSIIHASFCKIEPWAQDFPTPRDGVRFVGEIYDENEKTVQEHTDMLVNALIGK